MDDTEDDAGYPPNPHNHHRRRRHRHHHSHPHHHHNLPSGPHPRRYPRGGEEEEEDVAEDGGVEGSEEEAERDELEQSVEDADAEGEEDEEEDEGEGEEDDEEDEEGAGGGAGYRRVRPEEPFKRRRKRRRLDRLALGFEFAPRMAAAAPASVPSSVAPAARPPSRSSPADWSEDATFVLLDAWGDLFIQNGRKSLRSDEWLEVAKKVSQSSTTARSEAQCRNRLDTLKKKYKKEKSRMVGSSNSSSKWIYFEKMESLMSTPPPAATRQQPRLPCGFDSGEYVFTNSKVYVNRSNDLDEMRDSPGVSECEDDEEDDESDGLPPERAKAKGSSDSSSFRMLANSIQKFGEIYQKIESNKRQHMAELERMRKDFHRDLEIQKRQILERAQAEIAKIRQGAGDDNHDDGEEEEDEDMNNGDEEIDISLYDGSS